MGLVTDVAAVTRDAPGTAVTLATGGVTSVGLVVTLAGCAVASIGSYAVVTFLAGLALGACGQVLTVHARGRVFHTCTVSITLAHCKHHQTMIDLFL